MITIIWKKKFNNMIYFNNNLGKLFINGEEIDYPSLKKNHYTHKVTQINDHVYINGYEYKNGEWKKTLKGLFYYIF